MARLRQTAGSDLARRLKVAVPALVALLAVIHVGGLVLALVLLAFGCICLNELWRMAEGSPSAAELTTLPVSWLVIAGMITAAFGGPLSTVLLVLLAGLPLLFLATVLGLGRAPEGKLTWMMALGLFGIVWIGVPLACAIRLRELPHGQALIIDVLAAVFVSDSGAYLGGRAFGRHKLAPAVSPNKTVEGWVIGLAAAAAAVFGIGQTQDWLSVEQALVLGLGVAVVASVGDLFESFIKRDLGVKDTGRLFGAHGGALDRADAALFGLVAGYIVAEYWIL